MKVCPHQIDPSAFLVDLGVTGWDGGWCDSAILPIRGRRCYGNIFSVLPSSLQLSFSDLRQ